MKILTYKDDDLDIHAHSAMRGDGMEIDAYEYSGLWHGVWDGECSLNGYGRGVEIGPWWSTVPAALMPMAISAGLVAAEIVESTRGVP